MPMPCCTVGAVPGTMPSGVVVASTRLSISAAVRPALASAPWAASMASPTWCRRCGAPGCRCARRSTRRWCRGATAKSSLVTTLSGTAMPQPVMPDPLHAADPARTAWMHTKPGVPVDDAAGVDRHAEAGAVDLAGPARPRNWVASSTTWASPVAPSGWPRPTRPPLGLTTRPGVSTAVAPASVAGRPHRERRSRATRARRAPRPRWRRAARPGRCRRGRSRRPPTPPRRPGSSGRGSRAGRFPSGPPSR